MHAQYTRAQQPLAWPEQEKRVLLLMHPRGHAKALLGLRDPGANGGGPGGDFVFLEPITKNKNRR